MKITNQESPLLIKISFEKLVQAYRPLLDSAVPEKRARAQQVFKMAQEHPILVEGFQDWELLHTYAPQIQYLLDDTFSTVLSQNEIKMATMPFEDLYFNASQRFTKLLKEAGEGFQLSIRNLEEDHLYIMACSIVLAQQYGIDLGFKRPLFCDIPDANGLLKHYRVLYNADFMELTPTASAVALSEDDISVLLDNFGNIDLWKEKFPPHSWEVKGFVIANLFDVTADETISNLKSTLLVANKQDGDSFIDEFQSIFQSLFQSKDIRVGFSVFNEDDNCLEQVSGKDMASYLLSKDSEVPCNKAFCGAAFDTLFVKNEFFAISDVDAYLAQNTEEHNYKMFQSQGVKSVILAPLPVKGKLLGLLEIVSPVKGFLNSVKAYKLVDVMPYIINAVKRSKEEEENLIEAVIQHECTSIHDSVYWRFEKEAKRFLKEKSLGNEPTFKELVFNEVYPLYGQVDIKESSRARNEAIQKDLTIQLSQVAQLFQEAHKLKALPIYEEILFRIDNFISSIQEQLHTDSEQNILDFLKEDIHPILDQVDKADPYLKELIQRYKDTLDPSSANLYDHRKNYDETITKINKALASVIDEGQEKAQAMYPHYFERYKTDGVEHNMFIGEAITREESFNPLYLYNLRLWQLQVMCEMENAYYSLLPELPIKLDVASLVLVHNTPLSIRFRMDEKRFDVDGTYNARYEILKKRLDKALIKGTNERITQKGKIAIVYSQKKEEREYLRYIKFLQAKNFLAKNIEIVELESLQGASGLKAIRVEVLYKKQDGKKPFFTYQDLMDELKA